MTPRLRVHELPQSDWQHCEELLAEFATNWQPNWPPDFQPWLNQAGVGRWGLLVELCLTDLELRGKNGHAVSADDYLLHFPELADDPQIVLELQATVSRYRPQPTPTEPVTVDGRYELHEEIGRGSFAVVFRAWDAQLKREVALKRARWSLADNPAARARFLREAQLTAGLQHPNIVRLFDVILHDQQVCLVLDLVRGSTLEARLAAGQLSLRDGVALLAKVAEALSFAHSKNVIHRDLKPSNILLNEQSEPILTDFGLARDLESDTLTLTGDTLGTPAYMAPEQASGAVRSDPRLDVYSLGVILYRLLTGELPFRGTSRMVLHQLLIQSAPTPPRLLREGVPRDLELVCLKAMAAEPRDRYPTVSALQTDLQNWLAGRSVSARPLGLTRTLTRLARRHPSRAFALASLVFFILLAFSLIFWQWQRAEQFLEQSRQQQQAAEQSANLSHDAVADLLQVSKVHPNFWDGRIDPTRLEILSKAIEHFEKLVQAQPEAAVLRFQLVVLYELRHGSLVTALARPEECLPPIEKSVQHCLELVRLHPEVLFFQGKQARVQLQLAQALELAGRESASQSAWANTFNQFQTTLAKWPEHERTVHEQLRQVNGIGEAWFQNHIAPRSGQYPDYLLLLEEASQAALKVGQPRQAVLYYRQALAVLDRHPETTSLEYWAAKRFFFQVQQLHALPHEEAGPVADEGLKQFAQLMKQKPNPNVLGAILVDSFKFAESLENLKRFVEAATMLEEVARNWESLAKQDRHPANCQQSAGAVWHEAGNLWSEVDPATAQKTYQEALRVRRALLQELPANNQCMVDASATLFSLARLQERAGQLVEAEAAVREAIQLYEPAVLAEPRNERLQRWMKDRIRLLVKLLQARQSPEAEQWQQRLN